MRTFAISAIILAAVTAPSLSAEAPSPAPAAAAPTITLTDQDVTNWGQMQVAMDECIAGIELRSDTTVCRGLSVYLSGFAGRVQIAKQQSSAVPPPQPQPQPSPPPVHAAPQNLE